MDLKPGYKQTEVGVIPADWEIHTIGNSMRLINGRAFKPEDWKEFGLPIIRIQNLNDTETPFNYCSGSVEDRHRVEAGDLLFAWSGTTGTSFGARVWNGPTGVLNQHIFKVLPNQRKLTPAYAFLVLGKVQDSIEKQSHGFKASFVHVKKSDLVGVQLPLPPTQAEQEAIAEALSDADALIESLEQLISKKRHLKQGAMQELLRPKAEWKPTNLGCIADPSQRWSFTGGPFGSNLKSSDYTDEGVRIIQLQNIGDGEFKDSYEIFTSPQKADELLSCNIYPGEIILSKMGDPVARACIVPADRGRYLMCSDGIRLAVDRKRFNTYFVYTMINAPAFRTKAANAGAGSTRKRIGLTELRNLKMLCPCLSQQTAVSAILSEMDAEIVVLEAKLAKARQIKQGMMQVLLTGRIRLV